MVLRPEPVYDAVDWIRRRYPAGRERVILLSPQGTRLDDRKVRELIPVTQELLGRVPGGIGFADQRGEDASRAAEPFELMAQAVEAAAGDAADRPTGSTRGVRAPPTWERGRPRTPSPQREPAAAAASGAFHSESPAESGRTGGRPMRTSRTTMLKDALRVALVAGLQLPTR